MERAAVMRDLINLIEGAGVTYRVSQGPDTYRFIYDNHPSVFHDKRIKYFDPPESVREIHVIAEMGDLVIGMAGMQVNPHDTEQLWIKFISVDPAYQGRGIGKTLLRHIYLYADEHGFKMAPGSFSPEGERLRHLHDEWDKEFPRVAYDRDKNGNYMNSKGQIVRMNEGHSWSQWVRPGDEMVTIDVEKVRASWALDRDFYFDDGDHPNAIRGRVSRFNQWLERGEAIGLPELCLNPSGEITFINGRHRFVALMQRGVESLPVAVPVDQADEIRLRFGK
ncbi:MAG: N-acetyltransferase [Oxalobacteraceae bacterium]|nr:MAG: N-acetyltransferase [Oxalobacteraceae bacterium]